jgi:hypothetical protein
MTSSSYLSRDIEVDDIIDDAFNYLWESFDKALLLQLVENIEISVATEMAMMRLYKIAAWSTCAHDGAKLSPLEVLEEFTPDGEPVPVTIDPWARGTGKSCVSCHCVVGSVIIRCWRFQYK